VPRRDVRFTPESGHRSARWQCPLWAISRRDRVIPSPLFPTFQKNRGAFLRLSGFVTIRDISSVTAIVGTGAMTTFDYIAIGVLIVLGVFAVAATSHGKFKL
jgi:hypothetical protein